MFLFYLFIVAKKINREQQLSNNKYAENLQKVATKSELDKEEFWNGEHDGCYTYKPL